MKGVQIPFNFAFFVIAALVIVFVLVVVLRGPFFSWLIKVFPALAGSLPFA